MNNNEELLSDDSLINRIVVMAVLSGCILFLLVQLRSSDIGWVARDYVQFFAVVCSIILGFFRRHFSSRPKVIFLIAVSLLLGSFGVFTLGLLAGGVFFFPLAAIMLSLVSSIRTVATFTAVLMLFLALIAAGFTSGHLKLEVEADQLIMSQEHWAVYISCLFFFLVLTCTTIFNYRQIMGQLLAEISLQRDQLSVLADYDELTALPRLRLTWEKLSVACARSERSNCKVAMLFADLDDFKVVNDTFGHEAGDFCLKVTAQRMTAVVRPYDTISRIGGDEFMLILDQLENSKNAEDVAKKLITQVSQPIEYKGQNFSVGISIGIALFPDHTRDIQALKQLADQAMYSAKSAGKNTYTFVGKVSADKRVTVLQ